MNTKKLNDIKWPIMEEDSKGKMVPVKVAPENTKYILDRLGIHPRLNMLTKEIDIEGKDFAKLSLDSCITVIRGILHQNYLKLTKNDTWDIIIQIAESNPYSPVCEYLERCYEHWDGKEHINDLFSLFKLDSTVQQDVPFCKKLFRKWLLSCASMAFNDGSQAAQGVLVLVGPQGVGKTRFLYTLVPRMQWVTDGMTLNPAVKDDVIKAMRFWIVELGELGETMKREKLDALKQYFTQKTDVLRKPYARGIMEYPRRTVFIGTVNGDGFLKDNTGDRRYWPIAVEQVNNSTNVDISQVWGQVMHLWKDSEGKAYLTDEEIAKLEDMNQQYKFISAEERALLDLLDWDAPSGNWRKATATILCEELNFPHSYNRRMGKALQALSKKNNQVKVPTRHGSERLYTVPPLRSCAPTYDELGILK